MNRSIALVADAGDPSMGVFAVAGHVDGDEARLTRRRRTSTPVCVMAILVATGPRDFCAVFQHISGDLALTLARRLGRRRNGSSCCRAPASVNVEAKVRFRVAMAGMPTLAIKHPEVGLSGTAVIAERHGTSTTQ